MERGERDDIFLHQQRVMRGDCRTDTDHEVHGGLGHEVSNGFVNYVHVGVHQVPGWSLLDAPTEGP